MAKAIQMREVPDDLYWEWKIEKENGDYRSWQEYFEEKTGVEYEGTVEEDSPLAAFKTD